MRKSSLNEEQASSDRNALEYDRWFDRHKGAFLSGSMALKPFILEGVDGLEVGVGTGRFAAELGSVMVWSLLQPWQKWPESGGSKSKKLLRRISLIRRIASTSY